MARELRRLLLSPERLSAATDRLRVPLLADELHYLQRVLRLRDGDPFAVVDGVGHLWQARLAATQALLEQPLEQPACCMPPPLVRLELAVALPRRDGDVILRMASELGIDAIQPLLAERSVVERWNVKRASAIVREAIEQCERLWLPALPDPRPLASVLPQADGIRLWATTRDDALPALAQELARLRAPAGELPSRVVVAIGPEGGWTAAEEAAARAQGWVPVQLGGPILRSSTAAVAAAVQLCSWRDAL